MAAERCSTTTTTATSTSTWSRARCWDGTRRRNRRPTRPSTPEPFTDRLYRNELIANGVRGELRFTDVTREAGLTASEYGIGVTAGDFDNDGWTDLYVTNFGPNQLLRNRGDGTFEDVTATAGVGDTRWSVAASFFDYDRDGAPRPVRRQLRRLQRDPAQGLQPDRRRPGLLRSTGLRAAARSALPQQGRRDLRGRLDPCRHQRDLRRSARLGDGGLQRRRPSRHLRLQRHDRQPVLGQSGRRDLRRRLPAGGQRRQPPRPARKPRWASRRPTSTTMATPTSS